MGFASFISRLDLRRPLVFLCGPAINNESTDRRLFLKRYINKEWKRIDETNPLAYINAYPFIVDSLFNSDEIKEKGLKIKINVIEEIITNIAYKTYIFLDTMSTSYELGQFTNYAYDTNDVAIFLDKSYENRINNGIGEYISRSLNNKFVLYDAIYDNRAHINFPKNRKGKTIIPREIVNILESDNPITKSNDITPSICFTLDETTITTPGCIACRRDEFTLIFTFSIKNLFYYVASVYRRVRESNTITIKEMPNDVNDILFLSFLERLKKELLTSFVILDQSNSNMSYIISNDFELRLKVGDFDCNEIIYHMLYVIITLMDNSGNSGYPVANMKSLSNGISYLDSEIDLLNIKNKRLQTLLHHRYYSKLVKEQSIKINSYKIKGKYRKIVSYNSNHPGNQLRYLHNVILESILVFLPSSEASYAYKKGRNCFQCLKQHEGNIYFAKFDIHKYFESINLSRFKYKVANYVKSQFNKHLTKIAFSLGINNSVFSDLSSIINPLFVNYKLPIGFLTSPKISDFYLYDLDEKMNSVDGVTYTRYADDILISSKDKEKLDIAIDIFRLSIEKEFLKINESKTRYQIISKDNESFRFLGINIVKRSGNQFEYTISKSFIVETSKLVCNYIEKKFDDRNEKELEKIIGNLNYIKSISEKCYQKTKRLIMHKLKRANTQYIPIELHSYL